MVSREDFEAFEEVKQSNLVNMFHPDARIMSGLSKSKFIAIMKDYEYLKEKFE